MPDSVLEYSLAELCIVAAAECWRGDGEVLATGIGLLPRLAAGLAKLTFNPALMITDGENHLVEEPVAVGPRDGAAPRVEGWMPYDRTFSLLWSGRRHALVAPVQMDRFGQTNISVIGDHDRPKAALLGARGFPGNSVHHANSFFFPKHDRRALVEGEVDFVCGAGYNPGRWPDGAKSSGVDLRLVVTDLAVLDFGGPQQAVRVRTLHPGVTFTQVEVATGFPLARREPLGITPAPSPRQLQLIRERLDPRGLRKSVFKDDPPGVRRTPEAAT